MFFTFKAIHHLTLPLYAHRQNSAEGHQTLQIYLGSSHLFLFWSQIYFYIPEVNCFISCLQEEHRSHNNLVCLPQHSKSTQQFCRKRKDSYCIYYSFHFLLYTAFHLFMKERIRALKASLVFQIIFLIGFCHLYLIMQWL